MKKFLLMFVMLLGSVATMQAQSFNFACSTAAPGYGQTFVPAGFTQAQADVLFALDFETDSGSLLFIHPDIIGDGAELTVSSFGDTYEVDDPNGSDVFDTRQNLTFEAAIVYVRSLLGLSSIVEGFTETQTNQVLAGENFELSDENVLIGTADVYAPNGGALIGPTDVKIVHYPNGINKDFHPNGGTPVPTTVYYGIVSVSWSSFHPKYSVTAAQIIDIALAL